MAKHLMRGDETHGAPSGSRCLMQRLSLYARYPLVPP